MKGPSQARRHGEAQVAGLRRVRLGAGLAAGGFVAWHAAEAWRSASAGSLGALAWHGAQGGPAVLLLETLGGVLPFGVYLVASWLERRQQGGRGLDAASVSASLLALALLWHLATAWAPKWAGLDPWSRWARLLDLAAHPLGYAVGLLLVGTLLWHLQVAVARAVPGRAGSVAAVLLALALGWPLLAAWVALGTGAPPGAAVGRGAPASTVASGGATPASASREGAP